jgi:glycosyltransferase involved in cell wall biosynthesis
LAQALTKMLNNPGSMEQMGKNGKQKVLAKFNWDHLAAEQEAVYHKIVKVG